ncbi:uncharacterized protein PAC_17249 [Phialocephala subalpina]|uniref:Uncharacterized protein n=1 Tax=Phialocephala subalpina TaxID=576137 RepID=A0A1L7XQN6_9HELO|nr:uncharacterized protein PAC_17249 [Phialocephala subalpina]
MHQVSLSQRLSFAEHLQTSSLLPHWVKQATVSPVSIYSCSRLHLQLPPPSYPVAPAFIHYSPYTDPTAKANTTSTQEEIGDQSRYQQSQTSNTIQNGKHTHLIEEGESYKHEKVKNSKSVGISKPGTAPKTGLKAKAPEPDSHNVGHSAGWGGSFNALAGWKMSETG